MPLDTPAQYAEILDAAKAGGYAVLAVNVSSFDDAARRDPGFRPPGSDGIVQVSRLGSAGRSLIGHAPRPQRA